MNSNQNFRKIQFCGYYLTYLTVINSSHTVITRTNSLLMGPLILSIFPVILFLPHYNQAISHENESIKRTPSGVILLKYVHSTQ